VGRIVVLLLRKLAGRVVLAVAGASLAYLLAAVSLHPRATVERPPPPGAVVGLAGLDLGGPLYRRYASWAAGVVHGDLGRTLDGTPVAAELSRRAGVSLRLVTTGAALGTVGGILLGAYGATRQYGLADRVLTAGTLGLLSIPAVALAVLLQSAAQWTNARLGSEVFAWTGEYTPTATGPGTGRLRHLLLPAATIALPQLALCARYQRATMLDALNAAHVRTAVAQGLRRRRVLLRHALRVAVIPMPPFAVYGFAVLLTSAAITERAFAWHGLGEWLIEAIERNDVNTTAACGCATAAAISAAGLLSDLARAALDPRTRR
jgi:peptide/nickel transport system permease protein